MKLPEIKLTAKVPTPEQYKRPRSLGQIVDIYDQVKKLQSEAAALEDKFRSLAYKIFEDYCALAKEQNLKGLSGKEKHLAVLEEQTFIFDKTRGGFPKFIEYVATNKAYHLLQQRVNGAAVKAELEAKKKAGKLKSNVVVLPGLAIFTKKKASITKIKGKKV